MSALIGFLSGVGDAGVKLGTQHMKFLDDEELQKQRAEIEVQKEERLLTFKNKLVNQDREAMAGRVDQAAGAIADSEVAGKKALIGQGIVDKEAWTPEQQAAVDQSVAADKSAIANDPMTRFKAGVSTGDTSLKDAATVELGERRADREEKKGDQRYEIEKERVQIDSKRLDQQIKHQGDVLAETIKHNRALEANAAASRSAAEKLSPAAKAQLEIAQNKVQSAHKEEAIAARALDSAMKSTEFDPEKKKADIAAARTEFAAAKNAVAVANANYDKTGAAHLGAEWKTIEQEKPAEVAKPKPPATALAFLEKNPKERDAFVAKYGEENLPATAPAKPTKVLIGTTAGSHAPAPAQDDSQDKALRAKIMEKRQTLELKGVDQEVRLQTILEIRDLEDKLHRKSIFSR